MDAEAGTGRIVWKRKRFQKMSWKRKRTRKPLILPRAGSVTLQEELEVETLKK